MCNVMKQKNMAVPPVERLVDRRRIRRVGNGSETGGTALMNITYIHSLNTLCKEGSMFTKSLFAAMVVALVVAGCRSTESPVEENDQTYLQGAVVSMDSIAQYSESERYGLDDDGAKNFEYEEGFGKVGDVQSPITPLRWGRRIASVSREVSVDIQGDTAIATITKTFAGNLLILADLDDDGDGDTLIAKPFSDAMRRKVMFVRAGRFNERRHNWRPVAISLVEGTSPLENFRIDTLQIITPRQTITVTDPLNTWLWFRGMTLEPQRQIPLVRIGDSVRVRVTVSSQNDSSEVVMLRWGVGWGDGRKHRARIPMVEQSGSTGNYTRVYARVFIAHRHFGRFNAFIDALSHETLFDDQGQYSNKIWGTPYHLVP